MALETATLEHICNVIRRQVAEEIKGLTLIFVVYEPGKSAAGLNNKRHEIYKHPAADVMFPHLRTLATAEFDKTAFMGLNQAIEKSFIPPFRRPHTLGITFVNSADFSAPEDARHALYSQIWHIIELYNAHKDGRTEAYTEDKNIISPAYDSDLSKARANMLADVFGAIMMESAGQRGRTFSLSRQRCLEALQPITAATPELSPYPIAAEATKVIYEEFADREAQRTKPLILASEMTNEVAHTFDDAALDQWKDFAQCAQQMAWMGFDKNRILSMAIFTSEDPYVRSIAYLVAETLNLEPATPTDLNSHNPFTDQEVNERLHLRQCDQTFKEIMANAEIEDKPAALTAAAQRCNAELLNGRIVGWCAHALLEAAKDPDQQKFDNNARQVIWDNLLKLNRTLLRRKRMGADITPEIIQKLCEKNEAVAVIGQSFTGAMPETKATEPASPAKPEAPKNIAPEPAPEAKPEEAIKPEDVKPIKIDEATPLEETKTNLEIEDD